MALLQNLFGSDETRQQAGAQQAPIVNPALAVPEDLRLLVQQQLDAVATQRLAWHGEVWPGQTLNWQIEPDGRRDPAPRPPIRNETGLPRCAWSRRASEKSTRGSA
jgi:hypothetical protein